MINKAFRELSEYEIAVLSRLFSMEFSGKSELQKQVKHSTVKEIESNDNYGSIVVSTSSENIAYVTDRVPVMALTRDVSGGPVEVLLHVVKGKIHLLEFVRMDGAPMSGLPRLDILETHTRGGGSDLMFPFPKDKSSGTL
jgi:hypothetical protein